MRTAIDASFKDPQRRGAARIGSAPVFLIIILRHGVLPNRNL
jgi:hypothetical protein